MTINDRLGRMERVWRRPPPRGRYDWGRLSEAEQAEYLAISALTERLGGVDNLPDAEVERGAELAEQMLVVERGRAVP
jgi:hypothetical protein